MSTPRWIVVANYQIHEGEGNWVGDANRYDAQDICDRHNDRIEALEQRLNIVTNDNTILEQRLAAWENWDKNHGWAARTMLREYSMLAANRHALAAMPTATDAAKQSATRDALAKVEAI